MVNVKLVVAIIKKSLVEIIARVVPEYELVLLEAVHGEIEINDEETQKISGQVKTVDSAEHEYNDLMRVYGDDAKTGLPIMERVYRDFGGFLEAFNNCLADGEEAEEVEKPKRKVSARKPKQED